MAAMWENVSNHLPTAEDRAALYSAGLHAAAIARAGVVAMHAAAGTPALYVDCPLERSIRDLHTMEQHIAAQPLWLEDAGRVLVGHAPTNPLFMFEDRVNVLRRDAFASFVARIRWLVFAPKLPRAWLLA